MMYMELGISKQNSQKIVFEAMYEYLKPSVKQMQKLTSYKWLVPLLKRLMPIKFKYKCGYGWKIT